MSVHSFFFPGLAAGVWNNFLLLLPMAFIFAIGNALRARGFFQESDVSAMTKILYWIVSPAQLFRGSVRAGSSLSGLSSLVAALFVCALLASFFSVLMVRLRGQNISRERLAVSASAAQRPNTVFLGIPVVLLVFGEESLVYASVYAAVAMPVHNILAPILVESVMTRGSSVLDVFRRAVKSLLKNPIVLACVSGLLVYFMGLKALPAALDQSLHFLGICATGLSLLALGASVDIKRIGRALAECWSDTLVRLLIHPLLLLLWFAIFPANPDQVRVAVLMTAMPTAITLYIFAEGMKIDSRYAANLVLSTTMFSIVTISLWSVFLSH